MGKFIYLILLGILLCCTGCKTSTDFDYIEDSIRSQIYPAKLDNDVKFSIGSLSMGMLNCFIDDEEEADMFLREIKSVQIGVYKIHDTEKGAPSVSQIMWRNLWLIKAGSLLSVYAKRMGKCLALLPPAIGKGHELVCYFTGTI